MKYYLRHSYLENEESQMIEFKGHRAFAPEDVNKLNCVGGQATRRDISRHACGMLNTPNGGLILCGVLDNGRVEGLMLTRFQRDHLILSIQDTFKRYQPPVPEELYSVHFVPVVDSELEEPDDDDVTVSHQKGDVPHRLRTANFCWCDFDATAAMTKGFLNNFYVVEIRLLGHEGCLDTQNGQHFKASDGIAYIRRNAMTEQLTENQT